MALNCLSLTEVGLKGSCSAQLSGSSQNGKGSVLYSAGGIGVTFETWLSFYTSQVIKQEEENLS